MSLLCGPDTDRVPGWTTGSQPHFPRFKEKCLQAWNAQNRSPRIAHAVKKKFGRYFITPVATRWNSWHDSIEMMRDIMNRHGGEGLNELNDLMEELIDKQDDRPDFTKKDRQIAEEYCLVMKSPCQALDDLQGDKVCHAGNLLPRLRQVQHHFETLAKHGKTDDNNKLIIPGSKVLHYTAELLAHLTERFHFRFGALFKDEELLLGTLIHPNFRYRWTKACLIHEKTEADKELKMNELKKKIVDQVYEKQMAEMQREERGEPEPEPTTVSPPKEAAASLAFLSDMVGLVEAPPAAPEADALKNMVEDEFNRWVKATETREVPRPHHLPNDPVRGKFYIDLFMRYNTTLPSSASVERVFSVAGDVLRAKRNRLSAEHVNRAIFLKQNASNLKSCNFDLEV